MALPENSNAITARDVHLTYPNGSKALHGLTLSVERGEFLAIIGPNGSGKSSLLRVLAGLLHADRGEVLINGLPISDLKPMERARRVALVPQTLEIMPGLHVEDFVLLGRYAHLKGWRLFTTHDRDVARDSLRKVDALPFRERAMNEMSGGERQRAMLARALAQESGIILLDEPTSALDLNHQQLVYRLIYDLHSASGKTVVAVTHDLNLASQYADRLALMHNGQVFAQGPPAEILTPGVLSRVYDTNLAFGVFSETLAEGARPWVLPWARKNNPQH